MQKKINIVLFFFILTLSTSCGFKKINQDRPLIHLQKIEINGENRIAYAIKNNIILLSNKDAVDKVNVRLDILTSKSNKIKDKRGRVTRYTLKINGDLFLKNARTQETINKSFSKTVDYDTGQNYSNTINNEKNASKILVRQLSVEITNFIILTFKTK
jgi:hypothetical protein|tara:strand:- start:1485 stop:1958 length:474 start_codon:yes stop_codon:yes gene_type:complete